MFDKNNDGFIDLVELRKVTDCDCCFIINLDLDVYKHGQRQHRGLGTWVGSDTKKTCQVVS